MAAENRLTPLETSVLRTLVYADLFGHPLTLEEMHQGLFTRRAVPIEGLAAALESSALLRERVRREGPLYFLAGRAALVGLRRHREAACHELLTRARAFLDVYPRLPWVEAVLISGGAATGAPADRDVDLFVVSRPGLAWTAFLSAWVVKRLLGLRGLVCVNYVVDRDHLGIPDTDLFTAHQMVSLRGTAGDAREWVLAANPWVEDCFANSFVNLAREAHPPRPGRLEGFVRLAAAPWEALLRAALSWKWRRDGRLPAAGVRLQSWRVKVHFSDHQKETLGRFEDAWRRLHAGIRERKDETVAA